MIDVARRKEIAEPLGITYHVHDVGSMSKLGNFDLVTSAYLLNYAADEVMLTAMCQRILDNLAEGGMFIYVGLNPSYSQGDSVKFEKYGLEITSVTPTAEGFEMRLSALQGSISFVVYHLPMPTYERALARAGFARVEWLPLQVSDEGIKEFGEEFWMDALNNPLLTVMR